MFNTMISTFNEWSPLKRIVVGSATNSNWPISDPVFAREATETSWKESAVPRGAVPQWIIEQANEDLEKLAETLRSMNIEVLRPHDMNFQDHDGLYNFCPRDRLLIYGTTVIDPAMMYPCRDMELTCYKDILSGAGKLIHMPRNQGLILDAANVCRLGNKMLFLESKSGNRKAYNWLCDQFPDIDIEICNFYSGVHIDSTIVPLREDLVLLNASRVRFDTVPKVFDGWHKVWVSEIEPQDFFQYPYASKWIGMNMLVVDQHTVICDAAQTAIIKTLKSYNFEVFPMHMRHSRTLGGGFHCVTLDLLRY